MCLWWRFRRVILRFALALFISRSPHEALLGCISNPLCSKCSLPPWYARRSPCWVLWEQRFITIHPVKRFLVTCCCFSQVLSWHFCFRQVQRWLFHFLRLRKLQIQILDAGDNTVIENSGGRRRRVLSVFTQLLTRSYRIILVNRSLYMLFLLLPCISSWEVYVNCITTLYEWHSLKALPNLK